MRQLGKLKCLEHYHDDNAPWIILFHGYGADNQDLFTLGDLIRPKKTYNWLFPNGNLEVPIGPAMMGRAWWNIDMMALQQLMMRGEHRDFSQTVPDGLKKAKDMALEMIHQMKVPWNQIVLGGFSQGAMLATELYLSAPETPKGLMMLSGSLLSEADWKEKAKARAGQKFFQSHGTSDAILGFKQAQKLQTVLSQAGMEGSLLQFGGGHEIPPVVIQKASAYLDSI